MKFFLFFLLACFFGGLLMHRLSTGKIVWILVGFNLFIMVGYFFFNRI